MEVLLAFVILLTVLVPTALLIDNTVQQAAVERAKVTAAELADQYLESLSNATLTTLQNDISRDVLLTPSGVTIAGLTFYVWSHLEWADIGAARSLCTAGNPPQVIRATITVKWATSQALGETSIINPPYGTVVPGDGFLSIQIYGQNAPSAPADTPNLINVGVTVTPIASLTYPWTANGTAVTYNPDKFGCVYLEEPLGDYAVQLTSPSGGPTFIDWQENLSPSAPAPPGYSPTSGLQGGNVAVAQLTNSVGAFHFDEAGTVSFQASGGVPAATGMPVSISVGNKLNPATTGIDVIIPAGGATTTAQLFPYTTAYSVWYGACSAEAPASTATVLVTPQGTASAAITGVYPLNLQVQRTSGGAFTVPPSATATFTNPPSGCPAEPAYGLSALTGATTTYTDDTALIPGTYSVKVTDPSSGGGSATFTMVVSSTGVVYNSTSYPTGQVVPVLVP